MNHTGRQRRMPAERLLALLACPVCRSSFRQEVAVNRLTCLECGESYPVIDGVPILLTPASKERLESGKEVDPTAELPQRWWSVWFGRLTRKLSLGGPCFDPRQGSRIRAMIEGLGEGAAILDLGSGGRSWGPSVITMDTDRFPNVSLVGDGHCLPFADGTLDGVICTQVLEHVDDAEGVTREIWRALRPGGMLYVAVPFIAGYHPASRTHQDFRRLTHIGLQQLLSSFAQLDSGLAGGPSSSLEWILREYLAMIFVGGGRLYSIAYILSGWLTFWLRYLDWFLVHRKVAHRIACGFYVLGRKPEMRAPEAKS